MLIGLGASLLVGKYFYDNFSERFDILRIVLLVVGGIVEDNDSTRVRSRKIINFNI